jgi:hypothetical protein
LLTGALILFSACTKQVAGPKGDPGTPGKAGNLKKELATVITLNASSWALEEQTWKASVFVSAITRDVIERGEVKLYVEKDGKWWALPYGQGYVFTQYSIEENFIRLECTDIHEGLPEQPQTARFRLVVFIPAQ